MKSGVLSSTREITMTQQQPTPYFYTLIIRNGEQISRYRSTNRLLDSRMGLEETIFLLLFLGAWIMHPKQDQIFWTVETSGRTLSGRTPQRLHWMGDYPWVHLLDLQTVRRRWFQIDQREIRICNLQWIPHGFYN